MSPCSVIRGVAGPQLWSYTDISYGRDRLRKTHGGRDSHLESVVVLETTVAVPPSIASARATLCQGVSSSWQLGPFINSFSVNRSFSIDSLIRRKFMSER